MIKYKYIILSKLLFIISIANIALGADIGLLPFISMDTSEYSRQLGEEFPQYILNHSLNDSISMVPYDTILRKLDEKGLPRYKELSNSQLDTLCNSLGIHVLLVGKIDSLKSYSITKPQKQPYLEVEIVISIHYYDYTQNAFCRGKDTLKAKSYRTEKIGNKPEPKYALPENRVSAPLEADACNEILINITQQFYSKIAVMLCNINRDTIYQHKIVAGDQPRIIDIQGRDAYIYTSMGYMVRHAMECTVYDCSRRSDNSKIGLIRIDKCKNRYLYTAYVLEGLDSIAPGNCFIIPE